MFLTPINTQTLREDSCKTLQKPRINDLLTTQKKAFPFQKGQEKFGELTNFASQADKI